MRQASAWTVLPRIQVHCTRYGFWQSCCGEGSQGVALKERRNWNGSFFTGCGIAVHKECIAQSHSCGQLFERNSTPHRRAHSGGLVAAASTKRTASFDRKCFKFLWERWPPKRGLADVLYANLGWGDRPLYGSKIGNTSQLGFSNRMLRQGGKRLT